MLAGHARRGDLLLSSEVEHSAVLQAGSWHAARGGRFGRVRVDDRGRVSASHLEAAIAEHGEPAVLALQAANPEVGVLQPVGELAASLGVPVFVDACASAGRLPSPTAGRPPRPRHTSGAGPQESVCCWCAARRAGATRSPDVRVDERATGFENVPAALAAAAALRASLEEQHREPHRLAQVHARLTSDLAAAVRSIPDTEVFLSEGDRLPHVLAFSCLYVDGEALVTELDRLGFAVASGSACTASTLEPSHVLAAMGALTHGNVRVSLGRDTDPAEICRLAEALPGVVERLRADSGVPR